MSSIPTKEDVQVLDSMIEREFDPATLKSLRRIRNVINNVATKQWFLACYEDA